MDDAKRQRITLRMHPDMLYVLINWFDELANPCKQDDHARVLLADAIADYQIAKTASDAAKNKG